MKLRRASLQLRRHSNKIRRRFIAPPKALHCSPGGPVLLHCNAGEPALLHLLHAVPPTMAAASAQPSLRRHEVSGDSDLQQRCSDTRRRQFVAAVQQRVVVAALVYDDGQRRWCVGRCGEGRRRGRKNERLSASGGRDKGGREISGTCAHRTRGAHWRQLMKRVHHPTDFNAFPNLFVIIGHC